MAYNPGSIEERFYQKVDKGRHYLDCWEWIANKNNKGYGMLYPGYGKNKILAHRISYELHNGPIPKGKHVLHKCDNPGCVNPRHLFVGTHGDNMRDKESKGRANHVSILSEKDVREIKELLATTNLPHKVIAARYGVARRTISNITNGSCWKHV